MIFYTLSGIKYDTMSVLYLIGDSMVKNQMLISEIVKEKRRELGLTQEELARRVGVGMRFIRDVEQGKETVRLDKLNQVFHFFGLEVGAVPMRRDHE